MKARRTNEINEGMAHILCCHKKGEPQGVMESGSHTRRLDQANCRMGLPLFVFAHRLPILRRDPAFSAEGLNGNVRWLVSENDRSRRDQPRLSNGDTVPAPNDIATKGPSGSFQQKFSLRFANYQLVVSTNDRR
jgi:hypothetical protein